MKYRIITLIGLAGGTLAVCFGGWDKFLQTLLLFMAIDWFTGNPSSGSIWKSRNLKMVHWESRVGWKRVVQKRHDIVCSHCCPSGCIDGNRISE